MPTSPIFILIFVLHSRTPILVHVAMGLTKGLRFLRATGAQWVGNRSEIPCAPTCTHILYTEVYTCALMCLMLKKCFNIGTDSGMRLFPLLSPSV